MTSSIIFLPFKSYLVYIALVRGLFSRVFKTFIDRIYRVLREHWKVFVLEYLIFCASTIIFLILLLCVFQNDFDFSFIVDRSSIGAHNETS